jgi:hypothetical protein
MIKLVNLGLVFGLSAMPLLLLAQQPSVEELDQRCEEMRENRLKPLREAEIEKCKADKTKDPAWCERYYQDYGNATRGAGGKYTPRMFDDLAPCVQAREMKAKSREATLPTTKRDATTTDLEKTEKALTTSPEAAAAAQQGKVTTVPWNPQNGIARKPGQVVTVRCLQPRVTVPAANQIANI